MLSIALYHFHVTQIKRSAGQSAIASAAYRSGEKLHSEYYGEDSDILPDDPGSKVSVCAEKSYEIWKDTVVQKSAQIIFCDLSTPKGDVYQTLGEGIVIQRAAAER